MMGKDELEVYLKLVKESSMLRWWPLVADLPVPKPKTVLIPVPKDIPLLGERGVNMKLVSRIATEVREAVPKVGGLPAFLRTDHLSGKHQFRSTCFLGSLSDVEIHVVNLIEKSLTVGIFGVPLDAFVVREYLIPDWEFRAFNGLPIAPEVRVFVKDGEVLDWLFYWPEDAIQFWRGTQEYEGIDWRGALARMRAKAERESGRFLEHARVVASVLKGDWSVDFMRARDGEWYFIDAARAPISYGYDKVGGRLVGRE